MPIKYFPRALFKPHNLDSLARVASGLDAAGCGFGYTQVFHKARGDTPETEHRLANEYICGEIGRFLGLPIPPFGLTYLKTGNATQPIFSSFDFNFSRQSLPPVDPPSCWSALPRLCAGVLAFDVLIANEDRHDANLLVDDVAKPTAMWVFDHDQALLGGELRQGIERLEYLRQRLGVSGGETGGNAHIFLPLVDSCRHFYEWLKRINSLPNWWLDELCDFAHRELGISKAERKAAYDFLRDRRNRLEWLLQQHGADFPGILDWPKGLL